MPPKKDLDTATQIDSIFDGPDEPSNDREKVLSHDRGKDEAERESPDPEDAGSAESSTEAKDRLPGPYVPKSLAWKLDEVHMKLRRATGEKLSQSLIIECALRICLEEYEQRGDDSVLARLVREHL